MDGSWNVASYSSNFMPGLDIIFIAWAGPDLLILYVHLLYCCASHNKCLKTFSSLKCESLSKILYCVMEHIHAHLGPFWVRPVSMVTVKGLLLFWMNMSVMDRYACRQTAIRGSVSGPDVCLHEQTGSSWSWPGRVAVMFFFFFIWLSCRLTQGELGGPNTPGYIIVVSGRKGRQVGWQDQLWVGCVPYYK